jgi:hypothetical protein
MVDHSGMQGRHYEHADRLHGQPLLSYSGDGFTPGRVSPADGVNGDGATRLSEGGTFPGPGTLPGGSLRYR